MLGHLLAIYLNEQGHDVTGFARKESKYCKTIVGDARNIDDIQKAIISDKYDVVVNCIGILNKNVDNNLADGIYINSYLPHLIADIANAKMEKVIQISTDCVFSGKKGGYTEKDIADATTYYGRTKYLGELNDDTNLTIRTSIVGPEIKENGIGLFNWFMNNKHEVLGYTKSIWGGVTTLELAKFIEYISNVNMTGLLHLSNGEQITKCDLLKLFNNYFKDNQIKIIETDGLIENRSIYTIRDYCSFYVSSYKQMIYEMSVWMDNHKMLYKHYIRR